MRINLLLLLAVILLTGCPKSDPAAPGATATTGNSTSSVSGTGPGNLVMVFSATEGDQWCRDILTVAAETLGFDPWVSPMESGHLDLYGPYAGGKDGQSVNVSIAFTGLTNVVGLEGQQSIAAQVFAWLEGLDVDLVWLDGDQAQFQIGQELIKQHPILFTGVVADCGYYYAIGDQYTGLYKRHSMSTVFGEIWELDAEAQRYALICDDSYTSAVRVKRFVDIQELLPEGNSFEVPEAVTSWEQLRSALLGLDAAVDAVIVTGMGLDGCSDALLSQACPSDILAGITIPVVTLGPTLIDDTGVTSVMIDPSVHARMAVEHALDILGGGDPRMYVPIVPEEMSLFRSETEEQPDAAEPPAAD